MSSATYIAGIYAMGSNKTDYKINLSLRIYEYKEQDTHASANVYMYDQKYSTSRLWILEVQINNNNKNYRILIPNKSIMFHSYISLVR